MLKEGHKQKQRPVLFENIVTVHKVKLQKEKKSIDKHQNNKLQIKINILNPQQSKPNNRLTIQRPSAMFQSSSSHNNFQNVNKRYQPDQFQQMREQNILHQNAKNFILKIRKQRQENKGKFMILRIKQEQRKKSKEKELHQAKMKYFESYSIQKMQQIMNNIILHQSRIDYRQSKSMQRAQRKSQVRSKTEMGNHSQLSNQQKTKKILELPSIQLPRKRLTNSLYLNQQNQ